MTLPTVIWCRNTIESTNQSHLPTIYSFVFYKFSPYPLPSWSRYLLFILCTLLRNVQDKTRRPKSKGVYKSCLCLNGESQVFGFWVYQRARGVSVKREWPSWACHYHSVATLRATLMLASSVLCISPNVENPALEKSKKYILLIR